MTTIDKARFKLLLNKARNSAIGSAIRNEVTPATTEAVMNGIANLKAKLSQHNVNDIDVTNIIPEGTEEDEQADIIVDILDTSNSVPAQTHILGVSRDDIVLNEAQQYGHDCILLGESICFIGAAGTGKTTTMRKVTRSLAAKEDFPKLKGGTKYLKAGKPGIAIISYTRKAVSNIRHAVIEELKDHTITIHKLLQFQPVFYEIPDPQNPGTYKKTMKFEPSYHSGNPLPQELTLLIHEESSMEGVDLYNLLQDALPHRHQEVFIGDIQQLPPVFGLAILGFKLNMLKTVELKEVYRQALESPIITLAWKILEGNPFVFSKATEEYTVNGKKRIRVPALDAFSKETEEYGTVKFQPWQKKLKEDAAIMALTGQFNVWHDSGYYNPEEDVILTPFNKAFGTLELNLRISQFLGQKRGAMVHEVIAGFNKYYLAVGDRVLHDKEDAVIVDIYKNASYLGTALPNVASKSMDRWGSYSGEGGISADELESEATSNKIMGDDEFEALMNSIPTDIEERVHQASHCIVIRYAYSDKLGDDTNHILTTASEVNGLLGGYALTVHKAQGSEWEKVFFVLHASQVVMLQRELLYTAVTRARKYLHIICEVDSFEKGMKSQKVQGNTLKEKAEWFKGKGDTLEKLREEKRLKEGE